MKISRDEDFIMGQFGRADFSCRGRGARWRRKRFCECDFTEADLTGVRDCGCRFEYCDFVRTNTTEFGMGDGGKPSVYEHCLFQEVKLRAVGCCEFYDCTFIHCDFEAVDFGRSYFDGAVFIGRVSNCVFATREKETKKRRKNRMEGVSFRQAALCGVRFCGGVELDRIELPVKGVYAYFSDFRNQCDRMSRLAEGDAECRNELNRFRKIFGGDARQKDYLVNLEDIAVSLGLGNRTIRLIWDCADFVQLDGEKFFGDRIE